MVEVGELKESDSSEPKTAAAKKERWQNRTRVLVFGSRGATFQHRHLMEDFRRLLAHAKKESKFDDKHHVTEINEIAELNNCSTCLYFETRKKQDLYVWMANVAGGPTAKFLVRNIHTMAELRLAGNCLKGSRPILSFDEHFDDAEKPHLQLMKQLFVKIFTTPNQHPKSQPFIDHVFAFSITVDGNIWFRNYQVVNEEERRLEEIGPRMVLEAIKIFAGSFGGPVLFENAAYVTPNQIRREVKLAKSAKYVKKVEQKVSLGKRKADMGDLAKVDPFDAVFDTTAKSDEEEHNSAADKLKRELEKPSKGKKRRMKIQKKKKTELKKRLEEEKMET